jgi:hypothetical protein
MNKKIENEIQGLRESDFEFETQDKDEVCLYLKKTYRDGEVKWRLREIFQDQFISIGDEIECEKGYKQIIINGCINERDQGYKYCDISNASIVDKSKVEKPKDQIKKYLVNLWSICFPDKTLPSLDRNPKIDDFKITTVWGRDKAGHMGRLPVNSDGNYKLGVNWQSWHRRQAENRVRFLTHELTHILHSHHRESFFITHAKAVKNIIKYKENRDAIESRFGKIDWNKIKAGTLDGPHRQSSEIIIGDCDHRFDATNMVVKKMEDILEYDYASAQRFYLNPPLNEIKLGYIKNTEDTDYTMVSLDDIEYNVDFSDSELNDNINAKLVNEEDYGFSYGVEHLPVLDSDGHIVENDWYVNVIMRMKQSERSNKPRQMRDKSEIEIPCVRK